MTAPDFVWLGLGPQGLKSEKDLYFEELVFQLKFPICEVNLPIKLEELLQTGVTVRAL